MAIYLIKDYNAVFNNLKGNPKPVAEYEVSAEQLLRNIEVKGVPGFVEDYKDYPNAVLAAHNGDVSKLLNFYKGVGYNVVVLKKTGQTLESVYVPIKDTSDFIPHGKDAEGNKTTPLYSRVAYLNFKTFGKGRREDDGSLWGKENLSPGVFSQIYSKYGANDYDSFDSDVPAKLQGESLILHILQLSQLNYFMKNTSKTEVNNNPFNNILNMGMRKKFDDYLADLGLVGLKPTYNIDLFDAYGKNEAEQIEKMLSDDATKQNLVKFVKNKLPLYDDTFQKKPDRLDHIINVIKQKDSSYASIKSSIVRNTANMGLYGRGNLRPSNIYGFQQFIEQLKNYGDEISQDTTASSTTSAPVTAPVASISGPDVTSQPAEVSPSTAPDDTPYAKNNIIFDVPDSKRKYNQIFNVDVDELLTAINQIIKGKDRGANKEYVFELIFKDAADEKPKVKAKGSDNVKNTSDKKTDNIAIAIKLQKKVGNRRITTLTNSGALAGFRKLVIYVNKLETNENFLRSFYKLIKEYSS